MTVTFLSEALSKAAKRSPRRIRPALGETPFELGRERGAARGVVVTRAMLARYSLQAPSTRPSYSHET